MAGLVLSGLLFYLTASLVPQSVERARTFFENLEYSALDGEAESKEQGLVYNLGFDNRKDGRLWFMNRFSERAWLGLGVNVHTRDADGQELKRISASEAYFDDTQGHWVFWAGVRGFHERRTRTCARELLVHVPNVDDFAGERSRGDHRGRHQECPTRG